MMQFNQEGLRKHLADCFRTNRLQSTTAPATCVQALRHDMMIYCDCELPEVWLNVTDVGYHLHCVGVIIS